MKKRSSSLTTIAVALAGITACLSAAERPVEGPIKAFRGEPKFDMQQVFGGERFPNVVVATDGTVLATWGRTSLRVRRSEDGGETWGDPITVGRGIQAGGATVDETSGDRTPNPDATAQLMEETKQRGLLVGRGGLYGNAIRIAMRRRTVPPAAVRRRQL